MEKRGWTKRRRHTRAVSVSLDWDRIVSTGRPVSEVKEFLEEKLRPEVKFCTNSTYEGTWNSLSMSGYGTYVMPYGVIYEGHMKDGMFHGDGTMTYPMNKQQVKGYWRDGKLITLQYNFPNGLAYTRPWNYCKYPDRRFEIESEELNPAGREYLTQHQPTREITEGCYDVGDGFYDPEKRTVNLPVELLGLAEDPEKVVDDNAAFAWITRTTNAREHEWIKKHCRKAWDEPTGCRQHLYEMWFSGRRTEIEEFDRESEDDFSYTVSDGIKDDEELSTITADV